MEFIFIAIILIAIFEYNNKISTSKFFADAQPYFKFMMEDNYEFLLKVKYGDKVDVDTLYTQRIRNAGIATCLLVFIFIISGINYASLILAFVLGFVVFKMPYNNLRSYYNKHLHEIDQMLPYYLKSLEILIQHYTIPVALARSIDSAPDVFKPGLKKMIARIEAGESTVDPYMDFAKEYPVRDSMRMMRLLYRLSLGSQENKQEQLVMFAKNVSTLQNKTRELKYQNRLETMEKKTMVMLMVTGGGVLCVLMYAMFSMIGM
mgnify:FL=1